MQRFFVVYDGRNPFLSSREPNTYLCAAIRLAQWRNDLRPHRIARTRLKRVEAGVTLVELARESGLPRTYLSEQETGVRILTPQQEARRRKALERLAASKAAAGDAA